MTKRKKTGSYYTPEILSDFLVKHILTKYIQPGELSILEPSCGDGEFLSALADHLNKENYKEVRLDIHDINAKELDKACERISGKANIKLNSHVGDYLDFFLKNERAYSLIIGNPPYIDKKNLKKRQIKKCELVHSRIKVFSDQITSNGKIKNIWPAFVKANIMSLTDNGVLCLVLPAEILQVIYAKELRHLITEEFDRVEVFAFNELIFEGIQQDVIALIGVKGVKAEEQGFSFYQVDNLTDLKEPRFSEKNCNINRTSLDKWTNYILTDSELDFIDSQKSKLKSIANYSSKAEVGIVSAANNFFILSDSDLKDNNLNLSRSIIKRILPKGYVVPGLLNFTNEDFTKLKNRNKQVNFLQIPNKTKNGFNKNILSYLTKGEQANLHERYKMTLREHWYHVPSVWTAEALFIKRSHLFPKFFVNSANVLATDSFYRVIVKKGISTRRLVFSFYNSLTFVLAELEGRFYGGGVLELTPSEFKNLAIPYAESITERNLNKLDSLLRNGSDISEILEFTNKILLPGVDTNRLENIRATLVSRRIKKGSHSNAKVKDHSIKMEEFLNIDNQVLQNETV